MSVGKQRFLPDLFRDLPCCGDYSHLSGRSRHEAGKDREWWEEFERLPKVEVKGDAATIRDVRNFGDGRLWLLTDDSDGLVLRLSKP